MAKVVKTNNSTTDGLMLTTYGSFGNYVSSEANCHFPDKDSWRKRLCYTMIQWASNESGEKPEEVLEIMQFCMKYKIPYQTLRNWVEQFPDDIGRTYAEMKLMLASRRRVGSMTKKLDRESCYKDLHRYDPEWKEVDRYHSDLRVDNEDKGHIFNITVNKPEITTPEQLKIEVDRTKE